ncbi:MAG TPA: transcription termination/antitermination NusG family protein [Gemmataceae bacterium]|nr:transcription termination/antitermination NusG family protein [Gemmataceae bacterium]
MPILAAEPDRYPAHLFDGPPPADRTWFVLHTKPRQEKSLARHLLSHGVGFYLPTVPRRTNSRGRTLTAHAPLFPGYLFLFADPEERVTALTSNRIVHSLPVHEQDGLWNDLRQVNRLLGAGLPVAAETLLAPGTPVEITTGPLAGLCGTVIRAGSARRFVVRVDFIHQGASVLLEDCALLPLRGAGLSAP